MENTDQEKIKFKMETNSNINTIINTENTTPEEIKQVNKTRGRPKRTEQETTQTQEATKPKETRKQPVKHIKLDDEERQLLNIQSKLNNLKEAEETTKRHYSSLKKQSKNTTRH